MQQGDLNGEKDDLAHENDNPALSKVIERNILTIIRLCLKAAEIERLQQLALKIKKLIKHQKI